MLGAVAGVPALITERTPAQRQEEAPSTTVTSATALGH